MSRLRVIAVGLALVAAACAAQPDVSQSQPSPDALATALRPQQPPGYYVDQANKYFDTLDTSADPASVPNYSLLVARWELPPWLWLTGYGR
jgi:hypothetical protein